MEERNDNPKRIPRPVLIVAGILGIALLVWGGSLVFDFNGDSKPTVPPSIPVDVDTTATSMEQRREMIHWYVATIAMLEERINEVEKLAVATEDGLSQSYQIELTTLEQELDTLRMELKQTREASNEQWNTFKKRMPTTRARVEAKLQNDYRNFSVSVFHHQKPELC